MGDAADIQATNGFSAMTQDQMILARSKLWTPELDKLLRRWKKQLGKREKGHLELARKYSQRHYFFGVPATVLSALISTGIFATFRNCNDCENQSSYKCAADQWIRLAIGMLGLISAGLSAFQTFMNYQSEAENHRTAADDYGSMYRILDTMLMIPGPVRGDPVSTLQSLRNQYDDLIRRSPTLPKTQDEELSYEVIQQKKLRAPQPDQFSFPSSVIGGIADLKKMMSGSSDDNQDQKADLEKKTSNVVTLDVLDKVFAEENDHNTSDEDREVCIGFDLDVVNNYDTTKAALAAAQLATKRDMQIQESLQHALNFEIQRLEGHARLTPREEDRRARRKRKKGDAPPSMVKIEEESVEVAVDIDNEVRDT